MVGAWWLPCGGLFSDGGAGTVPPDSPTRRGAPKRSFKFMVYGEGFVVLGEGFVVFG